MVRFLKKQGWTPMREGGRHTVLGKGDDQVAVPRHTRLKTGTVAAIMKEAGIADSRDL